VHGALLGLVWCFVRYCIPTPSGRHRFTVLGAVDALTKEIITVVNESTVTAETVCQLLAKLAAHVQTGPITVVLDNARYQKCALVQLYAEALGIELLYLPSASPHLNLIERLWRYVRKECLYSHYYASYAEFRAALETCLATAHRRHRLELETLLAWNFQSFRDVQVLPV
jgi:transposase